MVLPLAVLLTSDALGREFVNGDNFLQNLPLRVLVGRDLRHGILPLWNPYLSSGTPLLAGFNAGAAYPATWLMAVLPTFTAWALNLALVYEVAILGMYLFLRRLTLGSTAATFGAATFALAGFMTAQSVHIDLIEGASWLPWMVLAVHALTEPVSDREDPRDRGPSARHALRWMAVLAVSIGLSLLSGGVESIIDSLVLVVIYGVGRLVTMGLFGRDRRRALGMTAAWAVAGVLGGVALGAAQWFPGTDFASHSQRAAASFSFFTSGSLSARLITLVASPFVLGTNQSRPGWYVGQYNFEEVTSYVGVLALIAACSLFLRRWRSHPESRHWWIWYVIVVVGLLSSLGGQTPFGHLLFIIPGVKSERLLSRNLLLVDFSLAVLLAWWVHLLLDRGRDNRPRVRRPLRGRWRQGGRCELVVTCAPLAVITAVCIFLWAGGPLLNRWLDAQYPEAASTREHVAVVVTVGVVIAAVATWVVLSEARFSSRRLRRLLAAVLVVDLAVFNWFTVQSPITPTAAQAQGATATAFRTLVGDGRFLIYDPDQFGTSTLYALGQTDLNVYDRLPSGQGYTALTDANYYDATGAHYQEDLDPATLAGSIWDDLNVSTLLSLPGYFVTPVTTDSSGSTASSTIPFPPHPTSYNSSPVPTATSFRLTPEAARRWYFGGLLTVRSLTVPVLADASGLKVGLVTPNGGLRWVSSTEMGDRDHRSVRVDLARPVQAGGVVIEAAGAASSEVGVPTVSTEEAGDVALNGRMQDGVTAPHWVFTGTLGPFGVFHNTDARGWAEVRSPDGGPPPAGSMVKAGDTGENGRLRITVHATGPALLVRSEAWSSGWRATVQKRGSSSGSGASTARRTPVLQHGVVQAVAIPGAGTYVVTFSYLTSTAVIGLLVSSVTAVALLLFAVFTAVGGIRRRREARRAGVSPVRGGRSPPPPGGR
jgi:hypothetical protein